MYYKPHTLERRTESVEKDHYGRIISKGYEWEYICQCRCDSNMRQEFRSDNGDFYMPKYHIVCDGNIKIEAGDYIRCKKGDEIRGEGKVTNVKDLNLLKYTEVWV